VDVEAKPGLVVEEVTDDFVGEIVRVDRDLSTVTLEDRRLRRRTFPLGPGFWIDGSPVNLVAPRSSAARAQTATASSTRTASGSTRVTGQRARVARASRIFVEGRHDAELVEKIWGDDLRVEGVVVEYLGGIDDLNAILADFGPNPQQRVGVLVDHLVPGSKESRIAEQVASGEFANDVLVVGHPFVDIWAAVKPERIGQASWPEIPRGVDWKKGICAAFGWKRDSQEDIANAWRFILSRVSSYADLEPALLGRVEELIDFVTNVTEAPV
jgi:hypothetical protein